MQQQQYDEAVLCMDNRLALIEQLVQLAIECPMQQQAVAELERPQEQDKVMLSKAYLVVCKKIEDDLTGHIKNGEIAENELMEDK